MSEEPNPYEPTLATSPDVQDAIPVWRRFLGSLFRIAGGITISIPLVAVAVEISRTSLVRIGSLSLEVLVALAFYMAVGGVFIVIGNFLSPKRSKSNVREGP